MNLLFGAALPCDGLMTTRVPKLAIVVTHPVQYYAPLFRALQLSGRVRPHVLYTWSQTESGTVIDPGFGRSISWDVPLRDGYDHEFVPNVARQPGPHHFDGIDNPSLVKRLESLRPDALLIFGWNLRSHLQAMRAFHGRLPVFFRGDSTLLDPQPLWRSIARRAALRWIYRHIDCALAVGSANTDYFEWCGVPRTRIELVPHAVDVRRFSDDSAEERAAGLRHRVGVDPGVRTLVYAGKFQPKKDPLGLVSAFLRSGAGCRLIMFGDGPLEVALRRHARVDRRIHILPFQNQSEMPAVYRVGDAFVLPSCGPGETWGLALNEAMASGRPVIASSRVGAARDLVIEGQTGWTFRAGDPADLARVIGRFRDTPPARLSAMGHSARVHAAGWSIEVAAEALANAVHRHLSASRDVNAAAA
jgi:glycosyltransferase involved in cell wall biosynthesis